ncbi:prepilin peptidase [Frigidibacter mobilis]|uniref:Peptidase A24A prepilin type IV n=1 Tax=Frigidibacter mobilis TaxID=1335048 RepID=A0A159Z865_9RHOB|nr:prepilin peptidase [Frigidibacter mobilis]AMY70764.1 peptidase A24A prepilin type IV [Frigidibacter mobilis]
MLGVSGQTAALVFLVLVTPVALYVCWTDLKFMKIRNGTGLLLLLIFAVAGLAVLPPEVWAWRWLHCIMILAVGFVLHLVAGVGAGDVKFAAAAAPFVAAEHAPLIPPLFAAFLLGAFTMHRIARAIPAIRRLTPDWVSWTRRDFPMGLAIAGTVVCYLVFAAFPNAYGIFLPSRM